MYGFERIWTKPDFERIETGNCLSEQFVTQKTPPSEIITRNVVHSVFSNYISTAGENNFYLYGTIGSRREKKRENYFQSPEYDTCGVKLTLGVFEFTSRVCEFFSVVCLCE